MLGAREAGAQVQEMPFRLTRTNNARCESRLKEDLEGDLGKGGFGGDVRVRGRVVRIVS